MSKKKTTAWTRFMDMHSGGGLKEKPYSVIYIEAPENEAKVIFYNRFGHNPDRVSCTCCGQDYSVSESESLEQATAFDRGCRTVKQKQNKEGLYIPLPKGMKHYLEDGEVPPKGYEVDEPMFSFRPYQTLADHLASYKGNLGDGGILVIYAKDIKDDDRTGSVPEQGYVWQD